MRLTRRPFLATLAAGALLPAALHAQAPGQDAARLPADDPRIAERGTGQADAPVTVQEFFSLTCSHCAAFHRDTWPQVKRELVDAGQVRWIWRDFPLDQVALLATMVARSLPPERYEGFIDTLFKTQDRWAFGRNQAEELARMAALAGMSRAQFDAVQRDEALARGILERRAAAEREFRIQATPSFAIQGGGQTRMQSGNTDFERFRQLVDEAKRA